MPAGLNSTELNDFAPAWVPEPNGRGLSSIFHQSNFKQQSSSQKLQGTWTILYNCCFTLSLCVVTAIHMNVGPAGETTLQWLRRECKWVTIAILAPEIMLYTAGKQWFSASRLSKKLNKLAVEEQTDLRTITTTRFWSGSETPVRAVHD